MTKNELSQILYALKLTFGIQGVKIFKKLLNFIKL